MFLDISKPLKPAPIDKGRALALIMSIRQSCCQLFSLSAADKRVFPYFPFIFREYRKNCTKMYAKKGRSEPASAERPTHPTLAQRFRRVWLF